MFKILALCLALSSPLLAGSDLDYAEGKTALKGYLAGESLSGKRPGVLIVHQWLGLTDYEKGRAEQVAKELGYVALAADIYGKERPKDPKEAGAFVGKYKEDRALYRQRLLAGLDALKAQKNVDPERIAVIGYCFGGMGALELARMNAKVLGAVSFHGSLEAKLKATEPIQPKVLVLHGADDPWADQKAVAALRQELDQAKADYKVVLYPGAVHAFTQPMAGDDPKKGAAYNKSADKRSWKAMRAFLAGLF